MQETNYLGNISHCSYNYNGNDNSSISYAPINIVGHIDKVINKYRNQLKSLKPKNYFEYENYQYLPNNQSNNTNNIISYKGENNNLYKNENISNLHQSNSANFDFNPSYNRTDINYNLNYKYNTINNKNNSFNNINNNGNFENSLINMNVKSEPCKNEKVCQNYEKFAKNNPLNKELERDNIKLQSLLTLEKTKVVQLTNLLKEKESENNLLKQKLNSTKIEFTNLINEFKLKYENYNIQTVELNKNIIKEFFEFFNENLPLFTKTDILMLNTNERVNFIENDGSNNKKNAIFIIDTFDKLIKKLLNDNKQLYNELSNFTNVLNETKNKTVNLSKNLEIMKTENDNLKKEINELINTINLLKENNIAIEKNYKIRNELVKNKSYSNLQNYFGNQFNNNYLDKPDYVYNVCNNQKINNNYRSITPIQQLRNKIADIEYLIINQN